MFYIIYMVYYILAIIYVLICYLIINHSLFSICGAN